MKRLNKEILMSFLKNNDSNITCLCYEIGVSRNTLNNWINRTTRVKSWKAEIIKDSIIDSYGYCPDDLFIEIIKSGD